PKRIHISVGLDTCGIGNGAQEVYNELEQIIKKKKLKIELVPTGCFGYCAEEPLVNVSQPGKPLVILQKVTKADVPGLLKNILAGKLPENKVLGKAEVWDHLTGVINYGEGYPKMPFWSDCEFFRAQKKIVLRNCGLINPEDIEEYIAVGGYSALYKALNEFSPEQTIAEVKKAKMRGRGGAGFPTGLKWDLLRKAQAEQKYLICNADEGDPGAYMNRNELESDPHMVIEGMLIAAYATGATKGIIYCRAEYPLAVERLTRAISQAHEYGLFGKNIFGQGFDFDLEIVEGAGAFVCGEETALIASLEGRAGRPMVRPPFPAEKGLWGFPTNINNVETWSNIPVIISKGADWFLQTGTATSAGTKVFSLVGKIKNTGLVELPFGSPLQTIIYNIGGGTGTKKKVKAVQTGGPSGGCIPASLFNTPVDYETLNALGAIMGSGGIVVMDQDNCMVDIARYFLEFTTSESCGKCVPCREGLYQELKMLKKITEGKGEDKDLTDLAELGLTIKDSALCGLGQTGANPVLTTMKYFPQEYAEHIKDKRCAAGECQGLFISPCENSCPLHINIPGFIQLYKENRLADSFEMVLRDNPLPSSTGRICHFHCKMRCRREDIDVPVAQGELHRYIADKVYAGKKEIQVYKKILAENLPATGKKIAIIGAGPAGLMAAYYLARLGHKVTVYEAQQEAGGILRYGIPQYRLPKAILKKEIDFIKKCGAKIVFASRIDTESFKKLERENAAVIIATGAYISLGLGIPGEELKGVHSGTEYLERVAKGRKTVLGKNVLVIGAGNVAIDSARTAFRQGAKVTVVYRREKEDMPANSYEIEEAEKEGIKFVFLAGPKAVLSDKKGKIKGLEVTQMAQGDYDVSGRKRPVATRETYIIAGDTILLAIGEKVDGGLFEKAGVALKKDGRIAADAFTLQAKDAKVYACGDAVLGPATAVEAMAQGRKAAEQIDLMLGGKDRFSRLFNKIEYANEVAPTPEPHPGQTIELLKVAARKNNFKEVNFGLNNAQAQKEAKRCLRCDVK
ncbi:MAG: FAD-dependent oxidoreductase, partial [Candidatus Margulisiibacteriota bacterium]